MGILVDSFQTRSLTFVGFFSGKHTGQLKDDVTSPGGTTIRAIQVLDRAGVRGHIMEAVKVSAERAIELGKPK